MLELHICCYYISLSPAEHAAGTAAAIGACERRAQWSQPHAAVAGGSCAGASAANAGVSYGVLHSGDCPFPVRNGIRTASVACHLGDDSGERLRNVIGGRQL